MSADLRWKMEKYGYVKKNKPRAMGIEPLNQYWEERVLKEWSYRNEFLKKKKENDKRERILYFDENQNWKIKRVPNIHKNEELEKFLFKKNLPNTALNTPCEHAHVKIKLFLSISIEKSLFKGLRRSWIFWYN